MKEISLDTACALHIGPRESLVRIAEATARGGKTAQGHFGTEYRARRGTPFAACRLTNGNFSPKVILNTLKRIVSH